MKNRGTEQEKEFLEKTENLLISLFEKYAKSNRNEIDSFSEKRIKYLITRSILSEKEFLNDNPITFIEP